MNSHTFIITAQTRYGFAKGSYPQKITYSENFNLIFSHVLDKNMQLFDSSHIQIDRSKSLNLAEIASQIVLNNKEFLITAEYNSYKFTLVLNGLAVSCIPLAPFKTNGASSLPDLIFYTDLLLSLVDDFSLITFAAGTTEYVEKHFDQMKDIL